MSPSTVEGLNEASASPIQEQQDDFDGHAANDGQEQDWLTFRRRCELCKQRKVRCRGQHRNNVETLRGQTNIAYAFLSKFIQCSGPIFNRSLLGAVSDR